MGGLVFLIYIVIVPQVILFFMELKNKKCKEENDDDTVRPNRDEESQNNDTSDEIDPSRKRKKPDGRSSSSKKVSKCRFCNRIFDNSQALGGHMNCHRKERDSEEYAKAQSIVQSKGGNYGGGGGGYPYGGTHSYMPSFQQGAIVGNLYQGGGNVNMSNASMMGQMGAPPRPMYHNSNQLVGASQNLPMNQSYPTQQHAQPAFQSPLQHGGSSYAQRPAQTSTAVPQTSYAPRVNPGQYPAHGMPSPTFSDSNLDMSYVGSTEFVHQQSNTFTGHLSQATGANPTLDDVIILESQTQSNINTALHQSSGNQAGSLFVDPSGNRPLLRPLNPSHFYAHTQTQEYDQAPHDHYSSHASYGTGVLSEDYPAVGVSATSAQAQYHAPGENVAHMLSYQAIHEEDEFGSGEPDLSILVVRGSGHGVGGSASASTDAQSQL